MQKLMQEAQKMQVQLQKDQSELEKTVYEGTSSLVSVKVNGKHEVVEVNISLSDDDKFGVEDKEMLEDMFMVAMNDALKKIDDDKNKKMSKYGQGLAGLM